jgi:hypothetical protein
MTQIYAEGFYLCNLRNLWIRFPYPVYISTNSRAVGFGMTPAS